MKKYCCIISFVLSFVNLSSGQTIAELFNALPNDYTPQLLKSSKDSILQYKTFTIPGGDSDDTEEITLSEENEDFIRLDYLYTTGQNGFMTIELRRFINKNVDIVLVYSRHSGMKKAFDQYELLTFDYYNGQLSLNNNLGLPKTIPQSFFVNTSQTLSTGYNLNSNELNSIEYYIVPDPFSDDTIRTEKIIYRWDGNKFNRLPEK